jgi:hypothetical protein
MATNPISTHHVRQVAELVQRLNLEEIQELFRLAPKLQVASAAAGQQADLVQWARQQLDQHLDKARPMQADDSFLGTKP